MNLIAELSITDKAVSQAIPVKITTRRAAKHVTLRIDSKLRCVVLTKPSRISLKIAKEFLYEKQAWIVEHFSKLPPSTLFLPGETVSILGHPYVICRATEGDVVWIQGSKLYVKGRDELIHGRVKRFLQQHAKDTFTARSHFYAKQLDTCFSKITVRDTTSRWGSCSSSGNISFSWRLIMAPEHVMNYVVAHEVCHLREMNHSMRFWQLVASVHSDYTTAKAWLKLHGLQLHAYH